MSKTYLGEPSAMQAFGTTCWLRWHGTTIGLYDAYRSLPSYDNDCEGCAGAKVPGIRVDIRAEMVAGVERCDVCELFPGDLDAAAVLAYVLTVHAPHLAPIEVRYEEEVEK